MRQNREMDKIDSGNAGSQFGARFACNDSGTEQSLVGHFALI